jgi:hypothetical protein
MTNKLGDYGVGACVRLDSLKVRRKDIISDLYGGSTNWVLASASQED